MNEPVYSRWGPILDTELDDAVEQILGDYIADSLWRIDARNRICAEIAARGFDVFARREDS